MFSYVAKNQPEDVHIHQMVHGCMTCGVYLWLQVELVQTVVDGVHLIIQMEKALERGKSINHLIPTK